MHLLLARQGTISDGEEAIDLGQTPGDVLFLSAADTELASLAEAHRARSGISLRLASFLTLMHPMSVDAYVERTARHAKLIVVRIIGGETYWPYGLEALHACAVNHGVRIAVLPGDDKPDHGLDRFSTVPAEDRDALWRYLVEGGAGNTAAFLDYCAALIGGGEKPEQAAPLLKAGLWWPGENAPSLSEIRAHWRVKDGPVAAIVFYRALVQSGQTQPVAALISALQAQGLNPLPIFVSSLKDRLAAAVAEVTFDDCPPDIVLNATGFALSTPGAERVPTVLDRHGNMVLQVIFSGTPRAVWETSQQGLLARDLAMNVALPEVDGRVLTRAVSFKSAQRFDASVEANIVTHEPHENRVAFVAELATRWVWLKRKSPAERRVALVLANYPNRDGRLGNGVGLDTPAGTVEVLRAMAREGYKVGDIPADGDALMRLLMAGPTNAARDGREIRETISLNRYKDFFAKLPRAIQAEVTARWGAPEDDPYFDAGVGGFALPLTRMGETLIGIQPARGYNIDPKETYHSPDLVPPHGYIAFYAHLRTMDAVVHMGKHGNLEWLPGKALALSETCYPEAVFGPMPHVYPFIVNDPGEGTQAKRRASAVIIDHLTPPLTRAESYGPLKDLEALVDEYYEASGVDPRRLVRLKAQILDLVRDIGLDRDAGIHTHDDEDMALQKLDAYLCDLKEMQIRDGLHIFGRAPEGRLLTDLLTALARVPRGAPVSLGGAPGDQSLQRAIAADAGLDFDPLDCDMAKPWTGPKPKALAMVSDDAWRITGDTVERVELLAAKLVAGEAACPEGWTQTRAVLHAIEDRLRPLVTSCGASEIDGFLAALSGRFVPPGPSGAPTRGRPDVLPTGRNFFSTDSRAVPTRAAWELGRKSAELLVTRYTQDHGEWPTSFGLTAWGTSNMRTGGDDIAQALALIGVKPVWDIASRRVTGYEITPLAKLGRPRVDVVLRISGFFRDAFPEQIALFDKAVRAVGALDEDAEDNPVAARMKAEQARLVASGADEVTAARRAGYRVFGAKPGAYGAGMNALLDNDALRGDDFTGRDDLAEAWLVWGGYAYGAGAEGQAERGLLEERLKSVQAVVQNQDNREHDLLDSSEYHQFEGGMAAAAERLTGTMPEVYHNDHSRPEKPVIRTLEEELSRVVRGRAVNPKWIAGAMRHGYKGAAEIAATVDYLFAFAATTGKVGDHHFEAVYQAYIADKAVHDFMADKNPAALAETAAKLDAAIRRGFWTPRSNSARFELESLIELNLKRAVNG